MTTLRFVPRWLLQGILPISFGLMFVARLLTLPERYVAVRDRVDPEAEEIAHEIARAEAELAAAKAHRPQSTHVRKGAAQ